MRVNLLINKFTLGLLRNCLKNYLFMFLIKGKWIVSFLKVYQLSFILIFLKYNSLLQISSLMTFLV